MMARPVDLVGGHGIGIGGGGGGEKRVEAPHVEQSRLPVALSGVEIGDAAHHQSTCDLLGGFAGTEGAESYLGDLGPRHPLTGGFVVDGVGVFDRGPAIVADVGDCDLDLRVQPHGDRHIGAATDGCRAPTTYFAGCQSGEGRTSSHRHYPSVPSPIRRESLSA